MLDRAAIIAQQPNADAQLRDARGCEGHIREELATGMNGFA
jgi:hypothetical protein